MQDPASGLRWAGASQGLIETTGLIVPVRVLQALRRPECKTDNDNGASTPAPPPEMDKIEFLLQGNAHKTEQRPWNIPIKYRHELYGNRHLCPVGLPRGIQPTLSDKAKRTGHLASTQQRANQNEPRLPTSETKAEDGSRDSLLHSPKSPFLSEIATRLQGTMQLPNPSGSRFGTKAQANATKARLKQICLFSRRAPQMGGGGPYPFLRGMTDNKQNNNSRREHNARTKVYELSSAGSIAPCKAQISRERERESEKARYLSNRPREQHPEKPWETTPTTNGKRAQRTPRIARASRTEHIKHAAWGPGAGAYALCVMARNRATSPACPNGAGRCADHSRHPVAEACTQESCHATV